MTFPAKALEICKQRNSTQAGYATRNHGKASSHRKFRIGLNHDARYGNFEKSLDGIRIPVGSSILRK